MNCNDDFDGHMCTLPVNHGGTHEVVLPDGCVIARWDYAPLPLDAQGCPHLPPAEEEPL